MIVQGDLPDEFYLAVGRLVRACADMESVLDLYVMRLTGMRPEQYFIIMGQSAYRTKANFARKLAKVAGEDGAFGKIFSRELESVISMRNAVCHGLFVGLVDGSKPAFRTSSSKEDVPNLPRSQKIDHNVVTCLQTRDFRLRT